MNFYMYSTYAHVQYVIHIHIPNPYSYSISICVEYMPI
jgi:hypothetical protein